MPNLNRVMLMGNLTRDPELRHTSSNMAVTQIGLAVNRRWKNQQGEPQEEVTFVDCEAWGRTAEVINQYLKKGRPIYVEGRLKLDSWDDKEGNKRSKMKVVIENFQFLDSRQGGPGGPGAEGGDYPQDTGSDQPRSQAPRPQGNRPAPANRPAASPQSPSEPHQAVEEEDIPF